MKHISTIKLDRYYELDIKVIKFQGYVSISRIFSKTKFEVAHFEVPFEVFAEFCKGMSDAKKAIEKMTPKSKVETKRRCKHCDKDISHKHPNAKFCNSHCKDKYHNTHNPRGIGLQISQTGLLEMDDIGRGVFDQYGNDPDGEL